MAKPQVSEMEQDLTVWNSSELASLYPNRGHSLSGSHHGEILQGAVEGNDGRLRYGLVTLRCKLFSSEAVFVPDAHTNGVVVAPSWKVKAQRAADLALSRLDGNCRGGRLLIRSNIPPCWGLGSSTSDVVAAIQAVANTFGANIFPELTAELAVQAEIASDSTMFGDRAVFFGFRDGHVIEDFGGRLPSLEVVGFNTDKGAGIDTLSQPLARYSIEEIEALRSLVESLRLAVQLQDASLVGKVASESARINQRHLPKHHYDDFEKLVARVGALGLQVAHSGTVVGLLFDPQTSELDEKIEETRALLAEVGIVSIWRFQTGND
jgi:uncharacterized protein involved in propanediol utilization